MRGADRPTTIERLEEIPRAPGGSPGHRRRTTSDLLAAIARSDDPAERLRLQDEVVLLNRCVAKSISRAYLNRGVSDEDLEQVAYLALVKAVRNFDPLRDKDLLSYAVPTIRGELKRHFRDHGWAVRPPRRIQELQQRINAAAGELAQQLQRTPSRDELADHLDVPLQDVCEALAADGCYTPRSLNLLLHDDGPTQLDETLGRDDANLAAAEARVVLGSAVRHLPPRERRIVELRFFYGLSQAEIGAELGVTQTQVSRLLAKIMADLRSQVA